MIIVIVFEAVNNETKAIVLTWAQLLDSTSRQYACLRKDKGPL